MKQPAAIALSLVLSGSASATTYINSNGKTTAVSCTNVGVTVCSSNTYDTKPMDSGAAIAVVAVLTVVGLGTWYMLSNYQSAYVMPLVDVDDNGVKTIGFKIEKSF